MSKDDEDIKKKRLEAKELKIKILSEEEFLKKINS